MAAATAAAVAAPVKKTRTRRSSAEVAAEKAAARPTAAQILERATREHQTAQAAVTRLTERRAALTEQIQDAQERAEEARQAHADAVEAVEAAAAAAVDARAALMVAAGTAGEAEAQIALDAALAAETLAQIEATSAHTAMVSAAAEAKRDQETARALLKASEYELREAKALADALARQVGAAHQLVGGDELAAATRERRELLMARETARRAYVTAIADSEAWPTKTAKRLAPWPALAVEATKQTPAHLDAMSDLAEAFDLFIAALDRHIGDEAIGKDWQAGQNFPLILSAVGRIDLRMLITARRGSDPGRVAQLQNLRKQSRQFVEGACMRARVGAPLWLAGDDDDDGDE